MNERYLRKVFAGTLLACVAVVVGCDSGGSGGGVSLQDSRIKDLVQLHRHAGQSLGHAPHSEEEFKEFVQKFVQDVNPELLTARGVGSVDELFTSERDGKPFVVLYTPPSNSKAADFIVLEAEGVDGKRAVGTSLGSVNEMTNDDLSAMGL